MGSMLSYLVIYWFLNEIKYSQAWSKGMNEFFQCLFFLSLFILMFIKSSYDLKMIHHIYMCIYTHIYIFDYAVLQLYSLATKGLGERAEERKHWLSNVVLCHCQSLLESSIKANNLFVTIIIRIIKICLPPPGEVLIFLYSLNFSFKVIKYLVS